MKETKTLLPRVIAISSGKGGVGKSSIAVNLGISLAKNAAKVCLLDADTGLANANILLGLTPQFSLEHVLYGAKPIEEVMLDGPHGLKIIPGANGISECVSLHPRQQLRLTRELARIESDFDFILIDTAAGISDTTLDFVSAAHHTLVVITPEPTSLTDAFSLIKLLKRRRTSIHYHVVVNMCSSAAQAKEVYHRFCAAVEKYINVECQYLGYILRDESMRAAVVLQNPVAMFPDTDPSCRSFVKLADSLDVITAKVTVNSSFSAYWHRQFREQQAARGRGVELPLQAVTGPSSAQTRDADYLSELRSRLLLLIEQGHTDEVQILSILQECQEVFVRRFDRSPVDPLKLIEQLLQSPERDDQLLRDIADRLKPWGGFNNLPPLSELADSTMGDLPDVVPYAGSETEDVKLAQGDSEFVPETDQETPASMLGGPQIEGQTDDELRSAPAPLSANSGTPSVVASGLIHHYDASRFGSQENLLDLLRRSDASQQTVVELLDALT